MGTYLFSYRMPKGHRTGSVDALAAWTAFLDNMGEAVIDRGNPIFESAAVGDPVKGTELGGYSLVSADSLDQAAALARECPALREGGIVEVGQITDMHHDA